MVRKTLGTGLSCRALARAAALPASIWMASFGSAAFAAGSGSGYVTSPNVEGSSGKFSTSAGHPGAPSCAISGRWAVDVTTPAGQAFWSTVLLAYSQNKPVTIAGGGQCNVWGDSETAAWIQLP